MSLSITVCFRISRQIIRCADPLKQLCSIAVVDTSCFLRWPKWLTLHFHTIYVTIPTGWLGGAMVLGKLPVPGRPSNLADSRARAYCACSGCGWGLFGHFTLIYLFSPLSPSLWETVRYRLKYCLKGPLNPKQPTNHNSEFRNLHYQFWNLEFGIVKYMYM